MNPNFPVSAAQKVASVGNKQYSLVDEGGYFVSTNPTVGTAIATTTSVVDDAATASATHAQNVPVAWLYNTGSPTDPNAKNIYLDYLRMMVVQVPTSATSWRFAIRMDNVNRYTSGGSVITPVNVNGNFSRPSAMQFNFGAVVTTALPSASARLVANGLINSAVPVTLDQWLFTFGSASPCMDQISGGSGAKNISIAVAPICIAPGWGISLEMWGASNAAAPSWEFELGHYERMGGL